MFSRSPSSRSLPLAALALATTVQLAAFWPGIMVWDSIRQYRQALSGRYDDWHPPAMNWLWRQLGVVAAGPAPMLMLQAALYWGGFALLVVGVGRAARLRRAREGVDPSRVGSSNATVVEGPIAGRWVPASAGMTGWLWPAAVVACALMPVSLVLVGTILKDSLMAGGLLLAAGLIAVRRPGDRWLGVVAAAILLACATLRFNAVPACLPFAVLLVPTAWRRTRVRFGAVTAALALLLAAMLPLANRALQAERSGVELSLVIYDLAGITRFSGVDAFPPIAVADPVAVNARCYTPVSWDIYAWWGPTPCPIQFEAVRASFAARGWSPTGWWLRQVAAHPIAYAEHRLVHANRNLRLWVRDADLPTLSLATDPNPWGFAVPDRPPRRAIDAVALASLATPLGWPVCWLALALACQVVRPRGGLGAALAWSAALYALSYVPLSVASEVRYHLWTMTAAALAAVLTLVERPCIARWRWVVAAALIGGTVAVASLARLIG